MKTQNIDLMTAEIDAHRAADLLMQGSYYDPETGRGCFIGCLTHGNDTAVIADRFGVPEPLTRSLESIFECLPALEAAEFFTAIPRAIGRDGRDLTRVHWAFLADLLRHLPDTQARDVVADVIAGMDLLAAGKDWPGAAQAAQAARVWAERAWAVRAWAAEAAVTAHVAEAMAWAETAEAVRDATEAAYWVAMAAEAAAYWAQVRAEAVAAQAAAVAAQAAAGAAEAVEAAAAAARARAKETHRQRDAILRLIREA